MKISRVYVFANGTRIDLERIICIGAIDKDFQTYNIIIPVYCESTIKPLHIVLGNSIGVVSPESKQKMEVTYNDFVKEWELFILQKTNQ